MKQDPELRALINSRDVPANVATRARIVLWRAEGRRRKDIAPPAGVDVKTVDRWLKRFAERGVDGLADRSHAAPREQSPPGARARIVELTRNAPPAETGLTHWSCRQMAKYLKRVDGIAVSFNYIAVVWREGGLKPHRIGTFKISKDPAFATKVVDVVGLCLDPPFGAVVLSHRRATVGLGRVAGVATGRFPRPPLRTGRARLRASGAPRVPSVRRVGRSECLPMVSGCGCLAIGSG